MIRLMTEHFHDKDAIDHVIQKRAEGIVALSESHGTEMPGHLSAGADCARELAVYLFIFWLLLFVLQVPFALMTAILIAFGVGLLSWKTGRSAQLGWARLERLHRVIEQERFEIESNRGQEREELTALYAAKGFEGKLLEDVIDVLMADNDRLLKVMLEEELGLTLQAYEHPIKQCLGALVGGFCTLLLCAFFYFLIPIYGMLIASIFVVCIASCVAALHEKNQILPALIWNLSIAIVAFGVAYYVLQALYPYNLQN